MDNAITRRSALAAGLGLLTAGWIDSLRAADTAPAGAAANGGAPANQVVIDNFAFAPKVLTVAAGTEVTWVNDDDEPHTVVYSGEEKLFHSPALDTNDKFSFTFKNPGAYNYYCSVHPHMTGVILVK